MSLLSDPNIFDKLFVARSKHLQFAFGAVYVFGRFSRDRSTADAAMTAAFWRCA